MKPDISIIVPVYNTEKYIEECLRSLIAQTFRSFEVIVVNDGSRDGSLEICDRVAAEDPRIRVFTKENGGLSDARNFGMRHAVGRVVGFVDSDDYLAPDFLEVLYTGMKEHHAATASAAMRRVNDDKDILYTYECSKTGLISDVDAIRSMLSPHGISNSVCNKLFVRRLFKPDPFPVGKLHEDEFVTYRVVDRAGKMFVSNDVYYYYRDNSSGITYRKFTPKEMDRIEASSIRVSYLRKRHPELVEDAQRYLSFDAMIALSKLDPYDPKYGRILQKKLLQNLKAYLKGGASFGSKGFAGLGALSPRLAAKLFPYFVPDRSYTNTRKKDNHK